MSLNISLAQLNLMVGDIAGNAERVIAAAQYARDLQSAHLVVFPELALSGYPPEDLLLRPELYRRVDKALAHIGRLVSGIDLVVGYPILRDGRRYNAAGLIRDGALVAEYHKQLLPNYGVFDEKRYFEPGSEPCVVEIQGLPVGLNVCEDIWQPEPMAQAVAAGARLLLNINASPFHSGKAPEREALIQARAREHGVPVVYLNLVGGQDELVFDGGSFVVDGLGRLSQRAGFHTEEQALVTFDAEANPRPAAVAPHPEEEAAIYQTLVLGVRDYVRKNGFHGAVLGLSGGIDSALTLALAVDALGADKVEVVLMPSRYTSDMSNQDAALQAEAMGVAHRSIAIEPAFRAFLGMLEQEFAGLPVGVAEENIQARCRGVILMAISNKKGKILLTTGNKSEMSVGYSTLYGDMAGGYAPIKDVPKLLVYRLARYRNRLGSVIPERVLERPPSAELAPDQKDADSLPPYEVLDPILQRYIEQDQGIDDIIAAGFEEAVVRRVTRLVDRNEYKRRQAPPGVRITQRAFGRDRRYPITSGF